MNKEKNPYELLLNENIIDIFLGKKELGFSKQSEFFSMSMPKLSSYEFRNISTRFSLNEHCSSLCENLRMLIIHCIKNDSISDLLSYFFSKSRFAGILSDRNLTIEQVDNIYEEIVWHAVYEINFILNFYNKKLVKSGEKYDIVSTDPNIIIDTPKIKMVDRDYILSTYQKAINDISEKNYDECLTKSRTLLEEVFCKVIEDKGEEPSGKGNIKKLYSQVKDLYNMHGDSDMDKLINTLISGLETIVNSVSEMRNKASDAHGIGVKRINILEHHAKLALNSALTMAEFVYSVAENANKK